MLKAKKNIVEEENELLVLPPEHESQPDDTRMIRTQGLGTPRVSRRLWKSDYILATICLQCFAFALTTVFFPPAAVWLGQVNQLISLGVLLQLMAICTQKQLQYFLLLSECSCNDSSLQNYESIIQGNFTSTNTSFLLRLVILFYIALPAGLGVAYKNSTGGKTILAMVTLNSTYGSTGQPSTRGLGTTRIALFENTTSPWWSNPHSRGTYGLYLFVESTQRAALLDGPTEEYVAQLREQLKGDETLVLDGLVNATACDMVFNLGNSSRRSNLAVVLPYFAVDNDFILWHNISVDNDQAVWYNYLVSVSTTDPVKFIDKYANLYFSGDPSLRSYSTFDRTWNLTFGMVVPSKMYGWAWNATFIMTSRWNATNNETFGTAAQGLWLYYRQYQAQGQVSHSTIKLLWANGTGPSTVYQTCQQENIDARNFTITCSYSLFQQIYPRVLMDLDWKYLGDFGYLADATTQLRNIKSDTVLVGAMVWSRLTTMWGLTNPFFNMTEQLSLGFRVYFSPSTYVKTTPALKRSSLLAVVLAANPIILLSSFIFRVLFLHNAPISKDFGSASLLASIDPDSLGIV